MQNKDQRFEKLKKYAINTTQCFNLVLCEVAKDKQLAADVLDCIDRVISSDDELYLLAVDRKRELLRKRKIFLKQRSSVVENSVESKL